MQVVPVPCEIRIELVDKIRHHYPYSGAGLMQVLVFFLDHIYPEFGATEIAYLLGSEVLSSWAFCKGVHLLV